MEELKAKSLLNDKIKFGQLSLIESGELLALIVAAAKFEESVAVFNSILSQLDGDLTALLSLDYNRLIKEHHIQPKIASKLVAISELARRTKFSAMVNLDVVRNSAQIAAMFSQQFVGVDNEQLWVLYLNNGNRVLDRRKISDGVSSSVVVDVKMIVRHAIKLMATKMVLVHNHPSGVLTPSEEDIAITQKIDQAAKFFDMRLLDHLIISPEGEYYSFNDATAL